MYSYSSSVCLPRRRGLVQKHVSGELYLHLSKTTIHRILSTTAKFLRIVHSHMTYCTVVRTPDTSTACFGTDSDRFPAKSRYRVPCSSQVEPAVEADLNYRRLDFDLSTRFACLTTQRDQRSHHNPVDRACGIWYLLRGTLESFLLNC